jgi:hypothetical protein
MGARFTNVGDSFGGKVEILAEKLTEGDVPQGVAESVPRCFQRGGVFGLPGIQDRLIEPHQIDPGDTEYP